MASSTVVFAPIMMALRKIEELLSAHGWEEANEIQKKFLRFYYFKAHGLDRLSPEELRGWASKSADELNRILKENGFDIRLEDFAPGEFGVVSVLDVLVEWLMKAAESSVKHAGRDYPAVSMSNKDGEGVPRPLFESFSSGSHPHPIACVHTKSGDKVHMTIAAEAVSDFRLVEAVEEIRSNRKELAAFDRFNQIVFPMVDLGQMADLSWLVNMRTADASGKPWEISQAMQQTKFKMNEEGARVKSAVAVSMRLTSFERTNTMRIDQPFLLWIEREGLDFPIMYAYIDTPDWKNPGSLDM